MSRIGKQPITLPAGVEARIADDAVTVKGSKGELTSPLFPGITVEQEGANLNVLCNDLETKKTKSFYGLARALLANSARASP